MQEINSDCCGKPIIKDFMGRDGKDICSKCLDLVSTKDVSQMRLDNKQALIARAHKALLGSGEAIEPLEVKDVNKQLEFALLCCVQVLEGQTPRLKAAESRIDILKKLFQI